MSRKIYIIQKDEAYSYDEVEFLEEKLAPLVTDKSQKASLMKILQSLKASLENQKDTAAVFFMPQNTFNIFSLIKGDNSICKIQSENIEALYKAFALPEDFDRQPIYGHLKKKIQLLKEYLLSGNSVTPTVIQVDNFATMEIT